MFNILIPKGGASSGTVTTSGSPSANQVAYFTSATAISGDADMTFDGTTLTATRVAIGNGATSSTQIFSARSDQNALTRTLLRNSDTGSSSRVQLSLNTDTGDVDLEATSVARGATASLNIGSSFTGGYTIDMNGANPINLKTNNTSREYINGAGQVGFNASTSLPAQPLVSIGNNQAQTILSGNTSQAGLYVQPKVNSAATAYAIGTLSSVASDNTSFTTGFASAFYENALSKGASNTITRYAGLRLTATTAGGTGNAAIADNEAYSGNWFINQSGSVASTLGGALTVTGTTTVTGGIVGITGATNAAAGNLGEYVESVISTDANVPAANGVWGDATSISLTAGDWDVSALLLLAGSGGVTTAGDVAIGTASGTSTTGLVLGSNWCQFQYISANGSRSAGSVPCWRANISGTTTYYLKVRATYSSTPTYTCRISARRVR